MPAFNYEFAATVLLEAMYTTDVKACQKYGVTDRTIRNYRRRLASDSHFSAFFRTKKEAFDKAWAEALPAALRNGIEFIASASAAAKEDKTAQRNAVLISAVAGAVKICADVHITGRIIDARIADANRPADGISGEVSPTAGDSQYTN